MKNIGIAFLLILLNLNLTYAQSKSEIENLLNGISNIANSKDIVKTEQAKKLIAYGWRILPTLTEFFADQNLTHIKSECHDRNLKKGEIAIIIADRIEIMPYAVLTGVQNCLMTYCENNPNWIEYYFFWINRNGIDNFRTKYLSWLHSKDRLDWPTKLTRKERKERKRIIKEWNKNTKRKQQL